LGGQYWTPDQSDESPWVEIDLERPGKISTFILFESGDAIVEFEIQCFSGGRWETAYTGHSVKNGKPVEFPEIMTRKVRIVLNKFSSVPGFYEFIIL
jgi:hypothetical protein